MNVHCSVLPLPLQVDSSMPHSPISAPSPRFEPISSSFSPDITPVIMAAHRDNYEILKILLDRGDKILKPHDVRCSCTDCVSKSSDDSLNHSRSRINAYRALASPSLIALSSKDPVLTAFELSWELRLLSKLENELKVRILIGWQFRRFRCIMQKLAVEFLFKTCWFSFLNILFCLNITKYYIRGLLSFYLT